MIKRGLCHGIVEDIAGKLISGQINAEEKFSTEHELCETYQVSRTVVREALRILTNKGLIHSRPKTGVQVQPIELWNFLDPELILWVQKYGKPTGIFTQLIEARHTLEPQLAALAAQNATNEDILKIEQAYNLMHKAAYANPQSQKLYHEGDIAFHQSLLEATHNLILMQIGNLIVASLKISFELALKAEEISLESLAQHKKVIDAIKEREPEAAYAGLIGMSDILIDQLQS